MGLRADLGVQPKWDTAALGHLPLSLTYLGDTGGSRGPPELGGEVGDGGRSPRLHGGQERPHRAVLHHEGLAAGAAGCAGGCGSRSWGISGSGRGQVTPLQLCCQARGLPHHLFQTGPTQGTPAPVAAPVLALPAWAILILLFLLAEDGEGGGAMVVSAPNATATKWQEPPTAIQDPIHCVTRPPRTPRTTSMRGTGPQDPQDRVQGVTCPLGPHLWDAISLVAHRTPAMSCHIPHKPILGVICPWDIDNEVPVLHVPF